MLKLTQTEYHFELSNGSPVILRIIKPDRVWLGNDRVIREWTIVRKATSFEPCTDLEVIAFEHEIGQIDITKIEFSNHETLGRIVYYDGPMLTHTKLTGEEFQLLCHNMHEHGTPCNRAEFNKGCQEFQDKLFGVKDDTPRADSEVA